MTRPDPKLLGGILFSLVFTFLLLEVGARAYFGATIGPRLVLYGTPWYRTGLASGRAVGTPA